jgi:hypothetical protein
MKHQPYCDEASHLNDGNNHGEFLASPCNSPIHEVGRAAQWITEGLSHIWVAVDIAGQQFTVGLWREFCTLGLQMIAEAPDGGNVAATAALGASQCLLENEAGPMVAVELGRTYFRPEEWVWFCRLGLELVDQAQVTPVPLRQAQRRRAA